MPSQLVRKLAVLGGLTLSLATAQSASAQAASTPAALTLDTSAPKPLPPHVIGGFNYGNWMPVVEAEQALKSVAPTLLRFPGGNVGDENDLIEASFTPLASNMQVLTTGGRVPAIIVQTRVFSTKAGARNTPQDAAQAARYAEDQYIEPLYWEIGNEPDLFATNRNDPSWTPTKYCQTFRAQRAAILKVNARAKFAGPAVSNGQGPAREFLKRFLVECGDIVDLLTWHEYPTAGRATDEDALASVGRVSDDLAYYRALLDSKETNPLGYTRNTPTGITEYGLSYFSNNPRHLSDQVGALWAAEATLRMAEGGLSVASYFALQATGGHGLVDLAGIPRPSLYAFQQVHAFKGQSVKLTSDNPALWTHAALSEQLLTVLVTNTTTAIQALSSEIGGYTLIGAKTFTQKLVDDELPMLRLKLGPALDLPARSMTRLVYKKGL